MDFKIRNITEEAFSSAVEGAWDKLSKEERISIRQSYINYLTAQDGLVEIMDSLKVIKEKPGQVNQPVIKTEQPVETEEVEEDEPEEEPLVDPETDQEIDLDEEKQTQ